MRVLIWNIHRGKNIKHRSERLCEALNSFEAIDLAGFIEADQNLPEAYSFLDFDMIENFTGLRNNVPVEMRTRKALSDGFLGLIWASHSAIDVSNIKRYALPSGVEPRGALQIEVASQNMSFNACLVHLSLWGPYRKRQMGETIKSLAGVKNLLLAGDFNDWRVDGPGIRLLKKRRDMLEISMPSFPARFPVFPLDRAFASQELAIKALPLPKLRWQKISDHRPLYLEITPAEGYS